MAGWNALFDQARAAFAQQRSFEPALTFGVSALACLGRRTLTGLLCATGQHFSDWSAAYRLFERERLDSQVLWRVPLSGVLETLPPASPIVALIARAVPEVSAFAKHVSSAPILASLRPKPFPCCAPTYGPLP